MIPINGEKLLQTLQELKVLNPTAAARIQDDARKKNRDIYEVLLERDVISDDNLGKVIAEMLNVPFVKLSQVSIVPGVLQMLPEEVARGQKAVVYGYDQTGVKLAMENPVNSELAALLAKKTGRRVEVFFATPREIEQALGLYKQDLQVVFDQLLNRQKGAAAAGESEAPATEIVNTLVEYAYQSRASDIHIEPHKKDAGVRFRIDGVLHDVLVLPLAVFEQVATRVKVAAKLRTDEHMAAQDGKMKTDVRDEELDIRVSIVPVVHGEKVVLRLLSARSRQFGLADLGLDEQDLAKITSGFSKPYGMVLVTGPTGSGKTTTIYAILKILNTRDKNIATIEDPVEYDIEGINQIQVNPKTNLTFAAGLKSILRQDPNVIFVGEIRDEETADIAVNSAMTGHLVLSTLHTNDSATTLPRLMDMKIEPYLVASTVNVISAQRLVRKICEKCRVSKTIDISQLADHYSRQVVEKCFGKSQKTARVYTGKGCEVCQKTGYVGRVGIFEVLVVSDEIKEMIMAREDTTTIRNRAVAEGMRTMIEDGLFKVQEGLTTVEEVLRVTKE